jgi:hypothetical protein
MIPFSLAFLFHGSTLLVLLKIGIITMLFLFIIFLFVVLRQVQSMTTIVTQPGIFPLLQLISYILIGIGIALFLVSIAIL